MVYRQTARSEAVRAESRERILQAAAKLFVERGYDATTMQDVVAEAGTSIGNAYFYFGSKERLVSEMIEAAAHAALDESDRQVEESAPGPARVGMLIAVRVSSMLRDRRGLAKLLVATDQRIGSVQILENIAITRWVEELASCLPERKAAELPAIAAAIWGVNRAVVQRVVEGTLEMDEREAVRFVVEWSMRALGVPEAELEPIVRTCLRRTRAASRARRGQSKTAKGRK